MSRLIVLCLAGLLAQACIPVAAGLDPREESVKPISELEAAFVFKRLRKRLPTVDPGEISTFSEAEEEALLATRQYAEENALLTDEKIQATVEDFNELVAFTQDPGFTEVLEWTGPMEGIEAGMDFQQMTDSYFNNMETVIVELNDEELEQLRLNLIERIDTLLRIHDNMQESETTMGQDEIGYALSHTILLRQKIIALQKERAGE